MGPSPESWNDGKLTLINKKVACFKINEKRPIVVGTLFSAIIARILRKPMSMICERENFFGDVQYSFRKNRRTSDCVLTLLRAIRKAKSKQRRIAITILDLAKAYDMVNHGLLMFKLRSLGFGGRTGCLISALYFNDNV